MKLVLCFVSSLMVLASSCTWADLPRGYKPIESISSTSGGKQWTRIGYVPNCTDKIEFKVKMPSLSTMCAYCSRTDGKVNTFTCFLTNKDGYRFRFDRNNDVDNGYSTKTISAGTIYEVVADGAACACTLNGEPVATMGSGDFEPVREMILFASYPKTGELTTANLSNFAVLSMYYFRVTDKDGVIQVDMVPCIRVSDGSVGMYDLQRKAFYRSWSSSGFVQGDQGEVSVTGVVAKQRWPWNGLVDIDFVLNGLGQRDERYRIEVEARSGDGETVYVARTFLEEPILAPGTHRVTWNFGADFPDVKADDLTFVVMVVLDDKVGE